uniref:Cadherin domain-containing protein n=1 Tax=Callorhinchus milii TaxID=7868 RepID=A0A4W3GBH0_CALMI
MHYLTPHAAETLVHAFVTSRLDYGNSLLAGLPATSLHTLQVIQNSAARVLSRTRHRDHITPTLARLHWLPIPQRIEFKILILTYKAIHGPGATEDPFGLFLLDPETGKINITGIVDREKTPVFEMIAQAYDRNNNPLENRLPIRIKILDINDNPPVFTQEVFHGSIEEWSPLNTLVMTLNATDPDEGENALVAYRIISQGGSQMFSAQTRGTIVTSSLNLDREVSGHTSKLVEGRDMDGKAGGLQSTAKAEIKILDVNDNVPTLDKYEYDVSVDENSKGKELLRIKVHDQDEEFTDNWLGDFEIVEGNENGNFRFEMDEKTNEGILILDKVRGLSSYLCQIVLWL